MNGWLWKKKEPRGARPMNPSKVCMTIFDAHFSSVARRCVGQISVLTGLAAGGGISGKLIRPALGGSHDGARLV